MNDQKFTLYWRAGTRQVVQGRNISSAMTRAGCGNGALRALDFYASGDCDQYEWNAAEREWQPKAQGVEP